VNIEKAEIVAILRSRGQDGRANWVERTLPEIVDTATNYALLETLGIDPAAMSTVGGATGRSS
jgi:hypothetical protein